MYEPATEERHIGYIKGEAHRTEMARPRKSDPNFVPSRHAQARQVRQGGTKGNMPLLYNKQ